MEKRNEVIHEYQQELKRRGVKLDMPIDILKGKSKIKLDNFDQYKIRCWDVYEEKFMNDILTFSELISRLQERTNLYFLSQTQVQDLNVLVKNSQKALCPICNGYHTKNDIDFSSDQTCMGVKVEAHHSLFGGDISNMIIIPSPNQEYVKNIIVDGEVQTKIIKT